MQNAHDSTFDHDAATEDLAEELALREALLTLGEVAGRLRLSAVAMRRPLLAARGDWGTVH